MAGLSNCGRWGRCVLAPTLCDRYRASLRLRSLGSARPCADFVRPLSCILCTFMNALLVSHPCETLGVHFIRHPCLTRKLRVLPPAAPKIIPRLLSGVLFLVPMAGVEPARYCYQRILSPSRLPIPSHRLIKMCYKTALYNGNNDFTV